MSRAAYLQLRLHLVALVTDLIYPGSFSGRLVQLFAGLALGRRRLCPFGHGVVDSISSSIWCGG